MNYSAAREQFKDGDIVFFKADSSIQSRIVRAFTGEHTHCGVAFWMRVDGASPRLVIAEAQPGGFRIVNLSYAATRDMAIFSCPVEWSKIADNVVTLTGLTPYNLIDLAKIGLHEKFGLPLGKHTGKGLVCSEIIVKLVEDAGTELGELMVSPQRLFEMISKIATPRFKVSK